MGFLTGTSASEEKNEVAAWAGILRSGPPCRPLCLHLVLCRVLGANDTLEAQGRSGFSVLLVSVALPHRAPGVRGSSLAGP